MKRRDASACALIGHLDISGEILAFSSWWRTPKHKLIYPKYTTYNIHTHSIVHVYMNRWKDGVLETVLIWDFIIYFSYSSFFLCSPPHIPCMSVCTRSDDSVQRNPTPCTVICKVNLHFSQPEWHTVGECKTPSGATLLKQVTVCQVQQNE